MKVSEQALNRIDLILNGDGMGLLSQKDKVFRISVEGGGCSGFKYEFGLTSPEDDDIIVQDGIVTDPLSVMYLENSTLNFKQDLFMSTFVIDNPDVKTTCGCGESIGF
jgi:iron-sulfur cluster assembly accessory protein